MRENNKSYIRADKGLLIMLLSLYTLFTAVVLLVLSLILGGKSTLYAVLVVSLIFTIFTLYSVLYFFTVRYEKGERCIKISSGILVRKYTYINRETQPYISRYKLPFGKGFLVVRLYSGTQVIFSTKVL